MSTNALSATDVAHLRRTLELAVQSRELGNRPFGAVLVGITGDTLAEGLNCVESAGNIIAHAEIDAIANTASPADLIRATAYASGEPCPMSAAALV